MSIMKYVTIPVMALTGLAMLATSQVQAAWEPSGRVEILTGCITGCGPDRIARMLQKIWRKHKLVKA